MTAKPRMNKPTTPLTAERLRQLFAYDPSTGIFIRLVNRRKFKAGAIAGYSHSGGYQRIMVDWVTYQAHRLAWLYSYGVWPAHELDHINGQRGDNRIANLREATSVQNHANMRLHSRNTSGFKGVSWRGNCWRATISHRNKAVHLGNFATPEEAHAAYCAKAKELFGEFARVA